MTTAPPHVVEGRTGLGDVRVLLVEDDPGDAALVRWALQRQTEFGYTLRHVQDLDAAVAAGRESTWDVVLLDLHLPGAEGISTVAAVVEQLPGPAVVVVTGLDDQDAARRAVSEGAQDYLVKSFVNPHEICRAIRYAVQRKHAQDSLLRVREEFLSHVSHELRTPLTAAAGALEMLEDGDGGELPPAAARLVQMVSDNLLLLRAMVGDLLDTTAVQSGRLSVHRRPVDAAALAAHVVQAMSPLAVRTDVELLAVHTAPCPVVADPDRMTQVLTNLVQNALRHTPAGGQVVVEVEHDETEARLHVVDTGCGISPADQERLFDRLYQVPKDRSAASRRGLGLGLYISREIVDAHGGTLHVRSREGEGSCFTVRLPLTAPDGPGA